MDFLSQQSKRPYTTTLPTGFSAEGLFLSANTDNTLEIGLLTTNSKPKRQELTKAWRDRRGGRATPVLLIAVYGQFSSVCGPSGDNPAIMADIDIGQAERLAAEALNQPDRLSAQRFLHDALNTRNKPLGIINKGMLALHNLTTSARERDDWIQAGADARQAAQQSGQNLLQALGYSVERLDNLTHVLRSSNKRAALAVLLDQSESIEGGSQRFNTMSPISYAMSKADEENLSWIIIIRGNRIRLYSTEVGKGVGRRGRTETYIECQPSLLADDDLGYLWVLFSAQALSKDGSLNDLLTSSERFAGNLAERLRDRIYDEVVPYLAKGIVEARTLTKPTREDLELTYQMALTVLFRLLFIAYAEDRDLLPYRQNEAYENRSLTKKAQELATAVADGTEIGSGTHHWRECEALFSAVNSGNSEWSVPTYNGGLFSQDPDISPAGAALNGISVPNEHFEPALRALLITDAEGTPGAVDFRSLGVREFGTIYEGLLEAELSAAESNLMLDEKATYVPVTEDKEAGVKSGEVYLHNKSGARKSSGSYYTKSFAVEYLLDGALEPALDDHFAKLDAIGSDVDAAEAFFDFRVADIAMGSGHFLVAAVDRIEARMANYLKKRQEEGRALTLVQQELNDLRSAAQNELGKIQGDFNIEDGQLLRRQIARRCIYGVDLNPLAVQLARLSIWIHTFVPGLPLSLLDHNLVHGNALVGVGTVDEIRDKFDQMGGTLFQVDADKLLGQAAKPLKRLANLKDATPADIEAGRQAMQEARLATLETEALCDLITAQPISGDERVKNFAFENWDDEKDNIYASRELGQAHKDLEGLHAFHFPVQFPEVFIGHNPGFNVILGNPPWEKVKVEEHDFWVRNFPGTRSLSQPDFERFRSNVYQERPDLLERLKSEVDVAERIRTAVVSDSFPGMGVGDPDLYKAFCWRFWKLLRPKSGYCGVVLPRSVLSSKGTTEFRRQCFGSAKSVDITVLVNSRNWIFDIHPQYSVSLVCFSTGQKSRDNLILRGPFYSLEELNLSASRNAEPFSWELVRTWTEHAALPLLPSDESLNVFRALREHENLASAIGWHFVPMNELHSTAQKHLMEMNEEKWRKNFWPVYKGASFSIWEPDRKQYYAMADTNIVLPWLQNKRLKASKMSKSVYSTVPKENLDSLETHYCFAPRIGVRKMSRKNDVRTIIPALLPPKIFAQDVVTLLAQTKGSKEDEAYLLGVLSSIPSDWYARKFVEASVSFYILNSLPIPRPSQDDPLWQRTVQLAGRLACPDERFKDWAREVSVEWGPLDDDLKQDMIHELDAVVAHLYGLNADQLTHIFKTFHEGWDYQPRLTAVLRHFQNWEGKA